MGVEIAQAVHRHPGTQISAGLDRSESPAIARDIGEWAGVGRLEIPITDKLDVFFAASEVVIDLSLPNATETILAAAVEKKTPLLCGTTGVSNETLGKFDIAAKAIPVLYARNLSLGVTVLQLLVEQAARTLNEGFDIEIVEMHHRNKVDAPSGTALALAESAAKGRGIDLGPNLIHGRSGHTGVRGDSEIGMHALRGGGVFGDHTVILASPNESVELTHRAASRAVFAEGAVKAALFLAAQKPGRYEMKDVLLS